jgi:tetratricopeptide (TPR) repeat protein
MTVWSKAGILRYICHDIDSHNEYNKVHMRLITPNKKYVILSLLLITLLTVIIYSPAVTADFTNWDDDRHIVNNPDIKDLSFGTIKKVFSSFYLSLYQPLTTLLFAGQYSLFGLNPMVYHVTNLLFHLINCILVFWLILRLTRSTTVSLIICAVFALHPLQVEAVAWISAFSIVLNTTFYLGALIAYTYYHYSGYRYEYYVIALLLFILALLSKSAAISIPVMLMVFDLFFQRKINRRLIGEKIPFFLLSLLFGIIAIKARHAAAHFVEITDVYSFIDRISIISYSVMHYIITIVIPINLSAVYPFPQKINQLLPLVFYCAPFVNIIIAWLIVRFRKRNIFILFSPLFLLVSIALVLQFMPFSMQMVGDRYTYLAIVGFLLLPAMGVVFLYQKYVNLRIPIIIFAISYLLALSINTFNRAQVWQNSMTLWNDVLAKYPGYSLALYHRGLAYYQEKNYNAALEDYNKAIETNPDYIDALNNRAVTHIHLNNDEQALMDFNRIIDLNPKPEYFKNRALLKKRMGNLAGALSDYNRAIMADASDLEAYRQRGEIRARLQDFRGAISDYKDILALLPDDGYTIYHLGILYYNTNQYREALAMLRRSIALDYVMSPAAWYYIGQCYRILNQQNAACEAFTQSYKMGHQKALTALEQYCNE